MKLNYCIVSTLGEYVDCMSKIAGIDGKNLHQPPVLWFRGLSNIGYSLIPSLFRKGTRVKNGDKAGHYSTLHYAEDIRTQHYIAKNYHFFSKEPSSRVEWLEVMQHHGVNTRILDWSESSIHALLFALEAFLDNQRFRGQNRDECAPCVWVLKPYYYFLSRIYSDGVILGDRKLPPFAMVHPYHSERIKAQKGVFTIFPYYEEQPCDEALRKAGIQPDAMEHNTIAGECLYRIIIDAPQSVASELLANGMFDSWLYPELPIAANEIENRKIYN